MFKKSILQIYALLSCFTAIIIFIFTLTNTIGYFLDINFTETKLGATLVAYETNEKYLRLYDSNTERRNELSKLSEVDLSKHRQEAKSDLIREKQLNAKAGLLSCFSWLLVGIILFLTHWKIYRSIAKE